MGKLTREEAFKELQERVGDDIEESEMYCCANTGERLVFKLSNGKKYFCRCESLDGSFEDIYLDAHAHACI